jgi:hypothetical protein
MSLRDGRWYAVYGLVIGLVVLGVWRLLAPWGYDPGFLLGFLLTQGAAVLVGFVLHEGLHLLTALRLGVGAGSVKVSWFRFWVLDPVEVGVYRRIVLAPLLLPVVAGGLVLPFAGVRWGLVVALLWLLGSADDLADWVRLVGVSGRVTNRPGEGLMLEVKA